MLPPLRELLLARQKAGFTQAEVAEKMGTKPPAVTRLETALSDQRHSPTIATLKKYAQAGCTLEVHLVPTKAAKATRDYTPGSGYAFRYAFVENRRNPLAPLCFPFLSFPSLPAWLYPLAGLTFAMGNAALEEAIFRGIMMDAVEHELQGAEVGIREAHELMAKLGIGPSQLIEGAYVDLLAQAYGKKPIQQA